MKIKSFILAKDNDNLFCQDSIAINIPICRFAVTDGATHTNMSHFFSHPLSRILVENGCPDDDSLFKQLVLQPASDCWNKSMDAYESGLVGRKRIQAQEKRKEWHPGASTMLEVEINNEIEEATYHILGDSTLFVITSDGCVQGFSSCVETNSEGQSYCVYSSILSNYLMANGRVYGNIVSGSVSLPRQGYIMLMTDGIAEWFQEAAQIDHDCAHRLWSIDESGFKALAEQARNMGKMDDDLALLMIYFDGSPFPELLFDADNQTPIYITPMPTLPAIPLKPILSWMTPNNKPSIDRPERNPFLPLLILKKILKKK